MANDIAPQIVDIELLEQVQQLLKQQQEQFAKEREELNKQIQQLQEALLRLKKEKYGSTSERLQVVSSNQVALFHSSLPSLSPDDEQEYEAVVGHRRKKKRKKPDRSELPKERIEYLPKETCCGDCGKDLVRIGEDIRQEIEYIPAQTMLKEHVSVKLGCSCCQNKVAAGKFPENLRILDKCTMGPGLLAKIVVSKYVDALPLYRQVEIFARTGFDTNRATLSRYVLKIAGLLSPVARALRDEILAEAAVHADETTLKRQESEKKGLHRGYLWAVLSTPGVYFAYDDSRSASMTKELLGKDFQGWVHCDHYSGYEPQHLPAGARRVACWAHTRRKFIEATTVQPAHRDAVLKRIARMYRKEREIKKLKESKRLAAREKKLLPLFEELYDFLKEIQGGLLNSDGLQDAISYALNQWSELTRILEHPALELDTNAIERQMKPVAVGRKNYLFAGSKDGAEATAVLYSLLNTCKIHKINPQLYLTDVLKKINDTKISQVGELTPLRWLQSQQR